MSKPGEHKTVQARILAYAGAIGWTVVSREEAERRRGFDPEVPPADRARNRSLFFDDLLDAKVREFNPSLCRGRGRVARAVPPSPHRHLRHASRSPEARYHIENHGTPLIKTSLFATYCELKEIFALIRHMMRVIKIFNPSVCSISNRLDSPFIANNVLKLRLFAIYCDLTISFILIQSKP